MRTITHTKERNDNTFTIKNKNKKTFIPIFNYELNFIKLNLMTASTAAAAAMVTLADRDELDVEDKGVLGGDIRGESALAVGIAGRDVEGGLLAHSHGGDALVPAADDLAHADGELEAVIRVETLAGGEVPVVVDLHGVAGGGLLGGVRCGGGDHLHETLLVGLTEVVADSLVLLPVLELMLLGAVHHTPAPGAELGGLELFAARAIIATTCHFLWWIFMYVLCVIIFIDFSGIIL